LISFDLPSNTKKTVKFREPTVDDCMAFCDLNIELEERSTTEYLNALQGDNYDDSINWTGDDRRMALWWIFINTHQDLDLTYNYHCQHCDEEHYFNVNMVQLDNTVKTLDRKPVEVVKTLINDELVPITVSPLNGRALQYIEQVHIEALQFDKESSDYAKAVAYMRMLEVVLSFKLANEPLDWEEAIDYRLAIVKGLRQEKEFKPLVAKIKIALQDLEHGLLSDIQEGIINLISPPHYCPNWVEKNEKGEATGNAPSTTLLMRFHSFAFIPNALEV